MTYVLNSMQPESIVLDHVTCVKNHKNGSKKIDDVKDYSSVSLHYRFLSSSEGWTTRDGWLRIGTIIPFDFD